MQSFERSHCPWWENTPRLVGMGGESFLIENLEDGLGGTGSTQVCLTRGRGLSPGRGDLQAYLDFVVCF